MASSEEEQASVLQLPFVAVQPDWTDDVRAGPKTPPATFWLSVLRSGAATLHADVAVRGDASARSGVRLDALISVPASASASASPSPLSVRLSPASAHELHVAGTGSSLLAELPAAGLRVVAPAATHSTAINGAPLCLDVSPGGELAVLGGSSGQLLVLDGRGSRQRLSLHGHLSDVAVCRFFPSGQVVLSGSGDFQLRIWDALSGACPVVLTGHRRSVTDVAIVERGRNVVSSSLDGDLRLWDCGSAATIVHSLLGSAINRIVLVPLDVARQPASTERDPRLVGADGKAVLAALESGACSIVDLATGTVVGSRRVSEVSVEAIDAISAGRCVVAAAGDAKGVVTLFDASNTEADAPALARFMFGTAPITELKFVPHPGDAADGAPSALHLIVGTGDGICGIVRIDTGTYSIQPAAFLSGWDLDAVRGLHVSRTSSGSTAIHAAAATGSILSYVLSV